MLSNPATLFGGCLCGGVRFAIQPNGVFDAGWCHCSMCRRMTGTAALAWVNVLPKSFAVTRGVPRRYRSSKTGERVFCGGCGSPLFFSPADPDGCVSVGVGCLDQPEHPAVRPRLHMFIGDKLCWLDLADALPRFADNQLSHPDTR